MIPAPVVDHLGRLRDLPAFVTDLDGLRAHLTRIRAALPSSVQLHYAVKANPEAPVLRAVAPFVDGFEVASGAEMAHARATCPVVPLAFGGPAKTPAALQDAVASGDLVHVESLSELGELARLTRASRRDVDVLLRVNPPIPVTGAKLVMGGQPSPFGFDPATAAIAVGRIGVIPRIRLRGLHFHVASGLDAPAQTELAAGVLAWTAAFAAEHRLEIELVNLGGGMAVDYGSPGTTFDWPAFGEGLARLDPPYTLRIEPGRSLTAYAGYYATRVLDVRPSYGEWFVVVEGGTHHLRTPAARGHDQPFTVIPNRAGPVIADSEVTVVGMLCTPRDVFARDVHVERITPGDLLVFELAGAYGWNISHHDFLMHPPPGFHYLGEG